MVTFPGLIPVTMPVEPTDAIDPPLLFHVPPSTLSDSESVVPWQIAEDAGEIADGAFTTVTVLVAIQVPME